MKPLMLRKHNLSRFLCMFCIVSLTSVALAEKPENQLALPKGDIFAPEVEHQAPKLAGIHSAGLKIQAKVTDNVGVKSVVLFYRTAGSEKYQRIMLLNTQGNQYSITISPEDLSKPGLEYYIQAEDLAGNTLLHGYSFSPLLVKLESNPETGLDKNLATSVAAQMNQGNLTKANTPFWKNKWLWIGVGVVAAAALSSGGDDAGSTPASRPNDTPTPDTSVNISVGAPAL